MRLFLASKILQSKQKIIELFPKIEKTLENIKEADGMVMQMQIKRQREFWHLLKIACVSNALVLTKLTHANIIILHLCNACTAAL